METYFYRRRFQGEVSTETTIVRTGGATDGTTAFSRKFATSADAKFYSPLEGPWVEFRNETLGSVTVAFEIVSDNVTYTDAEAWVEVHDAKLKALDSILEEAAGMPVLVAYHFRSDLDRLRNSFPQGRVLDKNPETISDWNAGKIPLLFAHPQSAGHGLNLQDGSNIIAFFSVNWNLEEHLQIIERIGPVRQMQSGHDRPVFIHYILAAGTIEDSVMERLEGKREVQDILMDAVKKYRAETLLTVPPRIA